jgi:hypothetical protein
MTDDEIRTYLGKRVGVLLNEDVLDPTNENPEGRITYRRPLTRNA